MLSFLKREKSKQLEDQLNAAQAQRRTGWENLPEDELFTPAGFSEEQAEATASSNYSYWGSTFRAFFKNKFAVALLIALVVVVAFAFIQPHLPGQADPNLCAVDPVTGIQYRNIAPGQDGFIWGSNSIGQDLWARIWAGARTSLTIAFFVALIEAVVGITAGVLWGYVRGLDFVFTELYNIFDNIPTAIVLILISYVATPSIWTMVLGMAIKGWIEMARFIRNQILIIRDRDYNVASRCIGTPTIRIVLRNLLPYLVSVIMLRMALTIPEAIGNEVFITYIGLGLSVETPSLGNLVNDGRKVMMQAGLRYQLLYPTSHQHRHQHTIRTKDGPCSTTPCKGYDNSSTTTNTPTTPPIPTPSAKPLTRQTTSSANSPATPSNSTHSSNDTSSKVSKACQTHSNLAGHNYRKPKAKPSPSAYSPTPTTSHKSRSPTTKRASSQAPILKWTCRNWTHASSSSKRRPSLCRTAHDSVMLRTARQKWYAHHKAVS